MTKPRYHYFILVAHILFLITNIIYFTYYGIHYFSMFYKYLKTNKTNKQIKNK